MGTELFNTDVTPLWRNAGTVTLAETADVAVGDPCHGLEKVGVDLQAGVWQWEVRDADEAGASVHREWEVRLRRDDQPPAEDLTWLDEYGYWLENPTLDGQPTNDAWDIRGFRGVDAGIIAWRISAPSAPGERYPEDGEQLLEVPTRGVALADGHLLITTSGWGDGMYPVAVRTDAAGHVVEVRTCYITPDLSTITAERFVELLPGALEPATGDAGGPLVGPFTLLLDRNEYTSRDKGDPARLEERSYETLRGLTGYRDAGWQVELTRQYSYNDEEADGPSSYYSRESCEKVSTLWGRVNEADRSSLVAAEDVSNVQDRPERVRGWIQRYTTSDVAVTLTV